MAITVETLAPGIIAMTVNGRVEKADIERAMEAIRAAKAESEKVSFLADLRGFAGFGIAAFLEDLRQSIGELRDLSRYERLAVVTDKRWVEWLSRAEGAVLPSMSVRVFGSDRIDDARRYALGEIVEEPAPPPALHLIMTDRPDAIAFSVHGRLTSADLAGFGALLEEKLRDYSEVDILMRLEEKFPDFDPALLFSGNTWATKFNAWRNLRRYALVGAPQMVGGATDFLGAMMPFEVRTFSLDHEPDAWKWIGANPAPGASADDPEAGVQS